MKKFNSYLCRIGYKPDKDQYVLYTSTDSGDTWNMVMSTSCTRAVRDDEDTEPMYIDCTLIEELKKAIGLGYTMVF